MWQRYSGARLTSSIMYGVPGITELARGDSVDCTPPVLLQEVYHGAPFVNGIRVMEQEWRVAA